MRYLLNSNLGGLQSRSERFGDDKNLHPPPTEIRTQDHPACGLVTVPAPYFCYNLCYSYAHFSTFRIF